MRFYVHLLGFSESEGGIIEIYPTSNEFDIGFVDLYTMETSYNDITFQTQFNEVFKYYPSSNNSVWKLETNMDHNTTDIRLVGGTSLNVNDEVWIESERVRVSDILGVNYYEVERGLNGSVPVNHFFSTDSYQITEIPLLSSTNKRLSPIGIICKFYSTNNIGGDLTILGYGQISDVALSNNKLITVSCKQLYKMLDKTYLLTNISTEDYMKIYNFLSYDNTIVHPVSNEFIRLLDIPAWFETDFYVECKRFNEFANSTKTLKFTDVIQHLLMYNNGFIKFDRTTGRYTIQKLGISTSLGTTSTSVFISSYLSLNDSNIEVKPFQRISTLNGKFKILSEDEDGKLVSNDTELLLKDDIIEMVSTKTLDYDISSLYLKPGIDTNVISKKLKDKIYFLNQVYDELTINTTKWKKYFEVGKKYIFNDSHIIRTLVDNTSNSVWICLGYENGTCKFISIESFNRYLISPFRMLTHATGDIWRVNSISLETSRILDPYRTYEADDTVYVYTYKLSDHTVTATSKTITYVEYTYNYRLTISGLSTDSDYVHFITYNLGTPSGKYSLFLYENHGLV